jgi:NAD(P)-dependent dehydrogenase (short-subunit alcohol dehydrogenase family)
LLAREVGGDGITVNVIALGLTVAPAVRKHVPAEVLNNQISSRAIQREETPEDLVGAFFFPSSDADFMSGQTISVDGGRHTM